MESVVFENDKAKCFYDKFPVNKGHMLIVPKRHCEDYFGLTIEEKLSIDKLVLRCQQRFYFP
ncbi:MULTISPECIES: HIT family protein [Bacillus]|uniref:HIT domain-containing protein n=6 Tax=Bacillus cereus group TaxID=86661 RepID=A0A4Y8SXN8_BACTU|nr:MULTISPECIES: HIT domain-containing protein [Bacillus]MBQ6350662.1 HIT domain-containing protein [Methanobrevibacter sp.]MCC2342130.1 HIT domain-containing protein [Bacillus tropicus]MCC2425408.1 HIT domain-containing protein [Bacillus wiedmannii]MCC2461729.1 HIT domain-containing protein [Bacillus mobilis]OXL91639.1 hypothetical protein B6N65_28160 [Bacillus sp. KbaB1]PNS29447.1 HIT domain-containing protein [Bacillus sp. AKBS9]TFF43411.1 HIT domain-containing protein [Bacillus thuringie